MKKYVYLALLIGGVCVLVSFYRFAYRQGEQACAYQAQRNMLAAVSNFQAKQKEVVMALNQANSQLERKMKNDQVCADVLNFDVRDCL